MNEIIPFKKRILKNIDWVNRDLRITTNNHGIINFRNVEDEAGFEDFEFYSMAIRSPVRGVVSRTTLKQIPNKNIAYADMAVNSIQATIESLQEIQDELKRYSAYETERMHQSSKIGKQEDRGNKKVGFGKSTTLDNKGADL